MFLRRPFSFWPHYFLVSDQEKWMGTSFVVLDLEKQTTVQFFSCGYAEEPGLGLHTMSMLCLGNLGALNCLRLRRDHCPTFN